MKSDRLIVISLLIASCVFAQKLDATKERVWSDKTGKHKVLAVFVKQTDSHVSLRKRDGKTKTLPIAALCQKDRDFLAALKGTSEPPEASPFFGEDDPPETTPATSEPTSPVRPKSPFRKNGNSGKNAADSGDSSRIRLAPNGWSYRPVAMKAEVQKVKKVTVPYVASQRGGACIVSQNGKWAAVSVAASDMGVDTTVVNLSDGKIKKTVSFTKGTSVVAIHGDGSHLAIRVMDQETSRTRLQVVSLGSDVVFETDFKSMTYYPERLTFVGDKYLPVLKTSDQRETFLNVINWQTGEVVYALDTVRVFGSKVVASSLDGATLAIKQGTVILLVTTATGNVVGDMTVPNGRQPNHYAFSPDGTRLAGCYPGVGYIWDLTREGERSRFDLPNQDRSSPYVGLHPRNRSGPPAPFDYTLPTPAVWANNQFLIACGVLIDTKISFPVWEYRVTADQSRPSFRLIHVVGPRFIEQRSGETGVELIPRLLPHRKAIERARSIPVDQVMTVGAGEKIRIETDLAPLKKADQERVVSSLRLKLERNGLVVSDDAKVRMVAKVVKEKSKEVVVRKYYRSGEEFTSEGSDADNTYQTVIHTGVVEVWMGEGLLYSSASPDFFSGNGRLVLGQFETVKQAVGRVSLPDTRFFAQIDLPRRFVGVRGGQKRGVSIVDASGVSDLPDE